MWLNSKQYFLLMLISLLSACATPSSQDTYNNHSSGVAKQAIAHTNLGAAYFQESKYGIALKEFKLAIKYDPNYAMAYNGLGLVQSALGENNEADIAFQRAIKLSPKNPETQNNYGNFLCNTGRHIASIPHFLEAVKNPLYKTPHFAYNNAGICAMRGKDNQSAEQYFTSALRIQPLLHTAAYYLSVLQFKRGDMSAAKASLQNMLIAAPTPQSLWLAIQIARKLKDRNDEASYTIQLRKKFPNSKQAKQL